MERLSPRLYRFADTCNVYLLRSGDEALLVDFGSGDILDHLDEIGVERVTDVLMTHHHRDQAQGLARAIEAGARIWVPHAEQDLFHSVEAHWQAREITRNYNMREDRFSLLRSVPVAGTLRDYATYEFGEHRVTVVPTPGHTVGSVTLMAAVDGRAVAFSGDLITAPGKMWSLAATQWSYNGAEGAAASLASLLDLMERGPGLLLPSHGDPIRDPQAAMRLLADRLWRLLRARGDNPRLYGLRKQPYLHVTPHLLFNRTSMANGYVLLSESGKALLIDYGYDFMTGAASGFDRASRRPWLYTLPMLKQQFGVTRVDVALPTHVHDDHVAGFNLLRDVEGTHVWAADMLADVLQRPARYDLPCLWYDPIPVDRVLPLGIPIPWEEYELTLHEQPGHTRHAVAVAFEVDGKRVLAVGDQYEHNTRWNYVYRNRFAASDYRRSAALYRTVQPDLLLFGHDDPLWVTPAYLEEVAAQGELLAELHRLLLPEEGGLGVDGGVARIVPYQSEIGEGEPLGLEVEVANPFSTAQEAVVSLVVPAGWRAEPARSMLPLAALSRASISVAVFPPASGAVRRACVAVDVTLGAQRFGQQAEALVTIRAAPATLSTPMKREHLLRTTGRTWESQEPS